MKPHDLRRVGKRLEAFLEHCFDGMGRSERRAALGSYLRGLLLDGERKSIEPMAERLVEDRSQVQSVRQRLQQAITVAAWDERVLFRRIAQRVSRDLPDIGAFVIDDTGFPKKGWHSVGVQRQYSGTLGRIDNCQIATSLHLASEQGGACIGMRLYLPIQWAEDAKRRTKTGVPEDVKFKEKWRLALDLLDDALTSGVERHVVVADAAYGDGTEFRRGLDERGLQYVLGVSGNAAIWPPGVSPSPPPRRKPGQIGRPRTAWRKPRGVKPTSIAKFGAEMTRDQFRRLSWRNGTRGPQSGYFAAFRIRTARRHIFGAPPGKEQWLLCEWPKRAEKPTTFYLSTLPATTSLKKLVYTAKLRWRIERDYQEMKSELGLDHFEGRGWVGFHHHVACVAAAHAFLTLERALFPPQEPTADLSGVQSAPSARTPQHAGLLSAVPADDRPAVPSREVIE